MSGFAVRHLAFIALGLLGILAPARADDWPQWMGPNRDAIWAETGILKAFPKNGPKILWQVPIAPGYAGPAVADGSVFVTDRVLGPGAKNPQDPFDTKVTVASAERIHCLDAITGREKWKKEYDCPYKISYPCGPRATPTVSEGKVYTLGAMGDLICWDATDGRKIWAKNFPRDYQANPPIWGFCSHPLVYQDLLISLVGGEGSVVVAFDKNTGVERWKALSAREPGYSSPTLINVGGKEQLIVWHSQAINGLDPRTGKVHWTVPLEPSFGMSIMSPRLSGDKLFAAGVGGAAAVLKLEGNGAKAVWQEAVVKGKEMVPKARGLYPVNMTPFVEGDTIYGCDQPGMLRAVELGTGKKLWFTFKPLLDKEEDEDFIGAKSGTAFVVKNGDRFFLFSETGELILAKLSPKKYEEIGRTKLLEPTGAAFGRKVVWSHPAFANKCGFFRNDKEIICVSLAQ